MEIIYIAFSVISAWLFAALMKFAISCINSGKFDLREGFKYGGMPSAHAATLASLTLAIFIVEGSSTLFAFATVISIIMISDLVIVPKNNHSSALRRHTLSQVSAGILIGIASSILHGLIFGFL